MTPFATLALGFFLGLRHALDPDHLVAVSAIAAQRRSWLRSLLVGAWWGVGHTTALLVVAIVVLALRIRIPDPLASSFELAAGALLVLLGANVIRKVREERLHAHIHEHEGTRHAHFHRHAASENHRHRHPSDSGRRAALVGVVHGLAGSAALMLLVVSAVQSARLAVVTVAAFGIGSIAGMGIVSLALGLFFRMAVDWMPAAEATVRYSVGALSCAFGLWILVSAAPKLVL